MESTSLGGAIHDELWRRSPRLALWLRYVRHFRRLPHLRHPQTFNEHVLAKLLFDRDPRLTLFADKFAVRDYVRSRLGGEDHLTTLYAAIETASKTRSLDLPPRFVMKPNHMSGEVKIVTDGEATSREELEALASSWLRRNYGVEHGEWAYVGIRPRVLFEELLEDEGRIPDDYRFYCFGGEPRLIRITRDRIGPDPTATFYDTAYRLLPVSFPGSHYRQADVRDDPPRNLEEMLTLAAKLAQGIDFVRVDLYNVGGRIVFGELTNYPQSGWRKFDPPSWDLVVGGYWPSSCGR